jgi:hypothetical protein
MLHFDLEKALEMAAEYKKNRSPVQQQALEEMLAMAKAARVSLVGDPLPEQIATLSNGVAIANIPMNLEVPMSRVLREWREYRGLQSADLHRITKIPPPRLSIMQSRRAASVPADDDLQKLAPVFGVSPGVLVTRHTPADLFRGVRYARSTEQRKIPKIKVYFERTYAQSIVEWGKFFGFKPINLAWELDIAAGRMRSFESGQLAVPQDLETIARKMERRFQLPPGVIFTRAFPEDVIIESAMETGDPGVIPHRTEAPGQ